MSLHANANWLITYDITDPRRLARLFKFLKKQGVPVQYSVFMVEASATKMGNLIVQIAKIVDKEADDVRAYRLPERTWSATLGASILPEGVVLGDGVAL